MVYCAVCAKAVSAKYKYCPECGKDLVMAYPCSYCKNSMVWALGKAADAAALSMSGMSVASRHMGMNWVLAPQYGMPADAAALSMSGMSVAAPQYMGGMSGMGVAAPQYMGGMSGMGVAASQYRPAADAAVAPRSLSMSGMSVAPQYLGMSGVAPIDNGLLLWF